MTQKAGLANLFTKIKNKEYFSLPEIAKAYNATAIERLG